MIFRRFTLLFPVFILLANTLRAQSGAYYFPPKTGTTWQTTPPADLGFCPERIDSLYTFLETHNTKSFMLLKDGKIVLEKYFGTFVQDSVWYWASAGKSLTAFMVGQAQAEGLLSLEDQTSLYLGTGWTSAPLEKENLIKLKHQITMTSGLDDTFTPTPTDPDPNTCKDPQCLHYLADAGTRWAYHTGAYRLLHDVLVNASGMSINQYTKTHMLDRTGMKGLWIQDVFYSKARDMARFGLLVLANGVWDGDTLLHDPVFLHNMTHTSQQFNNSYGYLWWLNGQENFMVPGLQLVIPGKLCLNAPDDMFAALGKNDQKIHIVPSKGWVVIRQGNPGGGTGPGGNEVPILFDNNLWAYLNALECVPSETHNPAENQFNINVYPNPAQEEWTLESAEMPQRVELWNSLGQQLQVIENTRTIDAENLPTGLYWLKIQLGGKTLLRSVARS